MNPLAEITFTLHKLGRHDLAVDVINTLGKVASSFEQYDSLSESCFRLREYLLGIKYAEASMSNNQVVPELRHHARNNLITLYNHANYPEKALRLIAANEALIGTTFELQSEKSFALFALNKKDEAEAIIRELLNKPDLTNEQRTRLEFNLGTYEMGRGNLIEGLKLFILKGRELGLWPRPTYSGEEWQGRLPAFAGETLLVVGEAGIGDEIINIRFLHHLKELGYSPVYVSDRQDIRNFADRMGFPVIDKVQRGNDKLWTYAMIVPVRLNLKYEELWKGPYLTVDPKLPKLNLPGTKKIAIRWQGNPEYDHDLHRNVDFKEVYECIPDSFTKYSIQRDYGTSVLAEYPDVVDLEKEGKLSNFDNTLNVLSEMDIVVTSCTSVAHASAALGKRTFVFVPISAYYVWTHTTEQSPWYGDNVTILRQTKPRCWKEPMAQLKKYLENT